ncbi:UDP-2,4-diacetamido-2,4,6-trideoxy-beta-L-altropyranose hydrolase [Vibrio cholerae]|uniref:UDP-2,4-diacetamido-2,4, 6-trideoxy-beta-L-altropyranose hydrolase n=1 Tax=Vibrio paracholerae TaxID=650003 RepID=UPI0019D21B10|nr:UDP-2,4-diacetamido-2,4,6-trideoxy-beta-L-altropyranose hydrolase [Vibrio paracholerae]MBN7278684.1 UDP-2,4-diacetamido-2,4,6-trideoxy-beta-L-altropyranose hydrolase [Vibrio paracholerae]MBN7283615.1 UDP-2,4-diacetamido-2,4,6-trideoxy-beta-L-altropyranose hydrolase [Vibrio paracholerae]
MRVALRADASMLIGTGHVMRCLTLADELSRQGHECRFVCREHDGHLGDLITSKGHGLTLLPASRDNETLENTQKSDDYVRWLGVPSQEDASQTLECLTQWKPDWLVVDHYALDVEWERALAHVVGSIMVIDDLANRVHECSLLLDQNLGRIASDYDGLLPEGCQRLIGPGYALLRPEFSALREQSLSRRKNPQLKRILISLGGVDRTNVTGQVLDVLSESTLPVSTELDIIMGPSAPYLGEVQRQVSRMPLKATVSVGVNDMAERMCLADLSIGAAGGTSWERCCLGLPAVLLVLAENQVNGATALEASGAALKIDDADQLRVTLPSLIVTIFESGRLGLMSEAAACITSGDGVYRALHAMGLASGRN